MPFSIDQGLDAGLDQAEGSGSFQAGSDPLTAQDGDTLSYIRADSGQDLESDGPSGAGTVRVSLRPWVTLTVGTAGLTSAIATRLLQDRVCVRV